MCNSFWTITIKAIMKNGPFWCKQKIRLNGLEMFKKYFHKLGKKIFRKGNGSVPKQQTSCLSDIFASL